jgi:hypothetical protein
MTERYRACRSDHLAAIGIGGRALSGWELIKARTAADDGAVWRSADGSLFKRTGGPEVDAEARFQQQIGALGYPVPEIVGVGTDDTGTHQFIERSAGIASLHDLAVKQASPEGQLSDELVEAAARISARLLVAQLANPVPGGAQALAEFFTKAAFADNVFAENPDLDTPRVHDAVEKALAQLATVPACRSHMDYGLPNAFPAAIIDWQHHGIAPAGYDVYPMLELVPFKGGAKGYRFTKPQRRSYLAALDAAAVDADAEPLSGFLGAFLLVKCFFFLALMRPADDTRPDKHAKWQYRRALFTTGLEQYESTGTIDTASFPTLAAFTASAAGAGRP